MTGRGPGHDATEPCSVARAGRTIEPGAYGSRSTNPAWNRGSDFWLDADRKVRPETERNGDRITHTWTREGSVRHKRLCIDFRTSPSERMTLV